MTGLLLDTHVFLWFAAGSPRLSSDARELIEDARREVWLSIASIWEMGIKVGLGRLELGGPMGEFVDAQLALSAIKLLEIRPQHVYALTELPYHHRDPFDRLLAAQCIVEKLDLVSADEVFEEYGVQRVW